MKKTVIGLLAALALSWVRTVYAADNGTEFGIEDDLTVLGSTGTATDPDLEVKGFSVFGATAASYGISAAPGNVVVAGNLQAGATAYFASSVTVAGYGVFLSTVQMTEGNLKYGVGAAGQVMKNSGNGYVYWGTDNTGAAGGTSYRVPMWDNTGGAFVSSPFLGNSNTPTSITMISGSSMTILGDGTDALGVSGATKLNGNTSITGANTFTVGTGLASLGGALNVAGASTLTGALTVNNFAQFGSGVTRSTFTSTGALDIADNANITLVGGTSKIILPNLPSLGTDAANKNYVDNQIGSGGPWTRDNTLKSVKLSTITDTVGIGIAAPGAKLHVSSSNAAAADYLFIVSSGSANRFTLQGDGAANLYGSLTASANLTANGNSLLGDAVTDDHGVNAAPVDGTALKVAGEDVSGKYVAEFYSGANRVAWLKKK